MVKLLDVAGALSLILGIVLLHAPDAHIRNFVHDWRERHRELIRRGKKSRVYRRGPVWFPRITADDLNAWAQDPVKRRVAGRRALVNGAVMLVVALVCRWFGIAL